MQLNDLELHFEMMFLNNARMTEVTKMTVLEDKILLSTSQNDFALITFLNLYQIIRENGSETKTGYRRVDGQTTRDY